MNKEKIPVCIVANYPELQNQKNKLDELKKKTVAEFTALEKQMRAEKKQLWNEINSILLGEKILKDGEEKNELEFSDGVLFMQVKEEEQN